MRALLILLAAVLVVVTVDQLVTGSERKLEALLCVLVMRLVWKVWAMLWGRIQVEQFAVLMQVTALERTWDRK